MGSEMCIRDRGKLFHAYSKVVTIIGDLVISQFVIVDLLDVLFESGLRLLLYLDREVLRVVFVVVLVHLVHCALVLDGKAVLFVMLGMVLRVLEVVLVKHHFVQDGLCL